MVIIFRSETPLRAIATERCGPVGIGAKSLRRTFAAQYKRGRNTMRRSRTALASEHGVVKNQRRRAATDTSSPATTPEHRRRRALLQLERLGYRVILEPVVT